MQELTTPFDRNDLVWAKVQHYPWWPGKIIEIFEQNKSIIFKISFFADPTYSYVSEDAIIPFSEYRDELNASFNIEGQLQKAIVLANNAFQRKKLVHQNKKLEADPNCIQLVDSEEQIVDQKPSKIIDFQPETIPIDFETDISNRKQPNSKKTTEIHNLLLKYKLHQIPLIPKTKKIQLEQTPSKQTPATQISDDDEEKIELFDLKNAYKKKSIKKRFKRRTSFKRKYVGPTTNEERKIQFMRRACSILISKGIETQKSRQITVKIVDKASQGMQGPCDPKVKKMNEEMMYVKLLGIVSDLSETWTYEEKLLHIFTSVDGILFQIGMNDKQEEEKTNIIYEEEVSGVC